MEEAQLIIKNLAKIVEHLADVHEMVAEISDINFKKAFRKITPGGQSIAEIFELYYQIVKQIIDIDRMTEALSAVDLTLLEKSETYKDEVRGRLKKITIATQAIERLPFKSMLERWTADARDARHPIENIQKLFHKYPETIQLYAAILQKYADTGLVEGLNTVLDADKDFVLENETNSEFKNTTIHLDNPPYKRFGLIPITDIMPLKALLPICLMEIKQTGHDMEAIAERANVGFIIMTHTVYNPVEYNVRALIIERLAAQYSAPPNTGPTKKMTERFNTIRESPPCKWQFKYRIINQNANQFYVLETLDGTNYRALGLTYDASRYLLSASLVHSLITFINSPNRPTRISNYQSAVSKLAVKNMFLPKQLDLESFEEKTSLVSPDKIRLAIYTECRKVISEKPPEGMTELNDMMHDAQFEQLFYRHVISLFNESVNIRDLREGSAGTFDFSEIYVSFLYDLRYITNKFMKELHDGCARHIYKPTDNLQTVALGIIDAALLLCITDKTDLYSSIHLKYMILNF
jgi:predicted DNA-binding protein YlxM (UPF0122 family)